MSIAAADPFGWEGATIEAKYRVNTVVGEGGFGVVYRGQHLAFLECQKAPGKLKTACGARYPCADVLACLAK